MKLIRKLIQFFILNFSLLIFSHSIAIADLPTELQDLITTADQFFQNRQWSEAQPLYQKIIDQFPDLPHGYIGVGLCAVHSQNYDQAISTLLKADDLSPNNPQIQAELANAYFRDRQLDNADQWYQKAIDGVGENVPLSWLINLGILETDRNELDQARHYYILAIQLYPNSKTACYNLGMLLLNENRLDEADACFETALEIDPKMATAIYGRGRIATKRKNWKLAKSFYESAITIDQDRAEFYLALSRACLKLGENSEAEIATKRYRQIRSRDYFREAQKFLDRKNLQTAIAKLKRAIETDATSVSAIAELASVQIAIGDLESARSTLDRGLSANANWAQGYWWRGQVHLQLNDHDSAETDFRSAMRFAPKIATPKHSLAKLLLDQNKNLEEALKLARSAFELDPSDQHRETLKKIEKKFD